MLTKAPQIYTSLGPEQVHTKRDLWGDRLARHNAEL